MNQTIRFQIRELLRLNAEVTSKMPRFADCGAYQGSDAEMVQQAGLRLCRKVAGDVEDTELYEYLDGFDILDKLPCSEARNLDYDPILNMAKPRLDDTKGTDGDLITEGEVTFYMIYGDKSFYKVDFPNVEHDSNHGDIVHTASLKLFEIMLQTMKTFVYDKI